MVNVITSRLCVFSLPGIELQIYTAKPKQKGDKTDFLDDWQKNDEPPAVINIVIQCHKEDIQKAKGKKAVPPNFVKPDKRSHSGNKPEE